MAHKIVNEYKINSLKGFNDLLSKLDVKFRKKGLTATLGRYDYPVYLHTWDNYIITIINHSM